MLIDILKCLVDIALCLPNTEACYVTMLLSRGKKFLRSFPDSRHKHGLQDCKSGELSRSPIRARKQEVAGIRARNLVSQEPDLLSEFSFSW